MNNENKISYYAKNLKSPVEVREKLLECQWHVCRIYRTASHLHTRTVLRTTYMTYIHEASRSYNIQQSTTY